MIGIGGAHCQMENAILINIDFARRAPFLSVVFFFRSDQWGSKLEIMLRIAGWQE